MHLNLFCTFFAAASPVICICRYISWLSVAATSSTAVAVSSVAATSAREAVCGDSESKNWGTETLLPQSRKKRADTRRSSRLRILPGACASPVSALPLPTSCRLFLPSPPLKLRLLGLCPGDESRNYFCLLSLWLLFWFFLPLLPYNILGILCFDLNVNV